MTARRIAALLDEAAHAGPLGGATVVGEAKGEGLLVVRIGLWLDEGGRVTRARFRSTTCAALVAFAETACRLAEGGAPPATLDGRRLRAAVADCHPSRRNRADLVALALRHALDPAAQSKGEPP